MRCSVSHLRIILRENQEDQEETKFHGGRLWVRLSKVKRLVKEADEVLFSPEVEIIQEWKKYLDQMTKRQNKGDSYAVWLTTQLLSHSEQLGTVREIYDVEKDPTYATIEFSDSSSCRISFDLLWYPITDFPPDWRPDEELPEDHYAL